MSNSEDASDPAEDMTAEPLPDPDSDEGESVDMDSAELDHGEPEADEPELPLDVTVADEAAATPVAETNVQRGPSPAPVPEQKFPTQPARSGRRRREKGDSDSWFELIKTVFYAVLIAVGVRTVLFQPFNIPSASMVSTLLIGDYLFVSKFSYGYSLYSLPWGYWMRRHIDLPGRILGSEPDRGDIVVFKYPPDNKTDYIKRLIGLPGDRIQVRHGQLFINGKAVPRERVEDYVETDEYGNTSNIARYRETLPGGPSYYVLDRYEDSGFDNTEVYTVPAGHYFMMGDNRDNSDDSRGHVGMVPYENLIGRARFIWWSIDDSARWFEPWTWPGAIRFDRIATVVD